MIDIDYAALINMAKENQFLIGGIGTVIAGGVMYTLRAVPTTIYNWFFRMMTIEINLNNQFPMYEEILKVVSDRRLPLVSRLYSLDNSGNIISGFGINYAFFKKRLLIFNRQKDDNKNYYIENTNITILSRNKKLFEDLIAEGKNKDNKNMVKVHLLTGGRGWGNSIERSKRSMESVFMAQSIKDEITSRIDWFLKNRDWYIKRGINYKLVFMLHGVPGSGKTSLLRALASQFNYRLGVVTSLLDFDENLRWAPENSFIVVEDIDALGNLNRDKSDTSRPKLEEKFVGYDEDGYEDYDIVLPKAAPTPTKQPTPFDVAIAEVSSQMDSKIIHDLLNSLDGLNTKDGTIIFMTTNHLDRLDAALIRPGRLDCCVEIGPLAYEDMARMYASFYETSEGLRGPKGYEPMVGAKLQDIFMRQKKEEAVKALYGELPQSMDI